MDYLPSYWTPEKGEEAVRLLAEFFEKHGRPYVTIETNKENSEIVTDMLSMLVAISDNVLGENLISHPEPQYESNWPKGQSVHDFRKLDGNWDDDEDF